MNKQQQELYEKLLKKVNKYCLGAAAEDVIEAIDNLVDEYECSGQTSFEALNAIKEQMPKYDEVGMVEVSKTDIRSIENALKDAEKYKKALEIIKEKKVNVLLFVSVADKNWDNTLGDNKNRLNLYNKTHNDIDLTPEEYKLLEEILK